MKERKQAEFLVFDAFPWVLIDKIGILHGSLTTQVNDCLANAAHQPEIAVEPGWYY